MAAIEINLLKELDFKRQLAFAYLTCERLYPNYVYFSDHFGFGIPSRLRKAIDLLYDSLLTETYELDRVKSIGLSIENIIPQPSDYATILASGAMDACHVVQESLDFLLDKNSSRLDYVSRYAIETVEMYIDDKEQLDFNTDQDFFKKLATHPLMEKEISIQNGIISFLSKSKSVDYEDVQTLLRLQAINKKSNLGLS
jgi:uncharacterized protein YjaG (DUF416 family)